MHKVYVYFCQGGERMGRPSFSPPLTSNFMFMAYSGQGNWRLAEFFPTPINHIHNSFPPSNNPLNQGWCLTLSGVGERMGWPSFSPALKSKGYMCIHDRVRLLCFTQTIKPFAQQFSPTRLPSEQGWCLTVGVGKRMGRPSFSPPPKKAKVTWVFMTG